MLSKVSAALDLEPVPNESIRADELMVEQQQTIFARTDRVFAALMIFQWIAGIIAAVWISPRTWSGAMSETHIHVWAAIFLGGMIASLPVFLVWCKPGSALTRHVIAVSQMLTAALFIHLAGGRIEAHFHIFGSLAFLACYRDWKVLLTATVVAATDHLVRGWYWPESVYGVLSGASYRFIEHAAWIVFEDVFLFVTIQQSIVDMRRNASNQARLESTNTRIESEVQRRTHELRDALREIEQASAQLAEVNKALEEQNKELDQFTYIASHDLQEPVRKLVSFSRLLEQDIDGELNEDAQRDLEFIVDAAKRMRSLVQALLELSRVGRAAMKNEPVDLNECVDDAINALQLRVEETGAEITREELPTVIGDQVMLTQLYQNLISNALKFIEDKNPRIQLTMRSDAGQCLLGVRDNGIGMKPEYAERIFQPFQRLHNRGEYEGTGIGLSICKKTVQRHGGEIWVQSEKDQGAHFQFSLRECFETHSGATPEEKLNASPVAMTAIAVAPVTVVPGSVVQAM
ncbi:sensor histidine kinase [Rhodopirellula sp. SWK7]|uniref:sensor histidine kinase n=1 Tax=Rhodopirellula sp. SWK7 TaxID=595460 RepID=UPI000344F454|nr:ATP-binding protein [Rhodopirellula sp. SWK7]